MKERLTITLNIAGKLYKISINRDEEENLRAAGEIVNNRLINYQKKYKQKNNEDFLTYIAIQNAKDFLDIKEKLNLSSINDDLKIINTELEEYINENK